MNWWPFRSKRQPPTESTKIKAAEQALSEAQRRLEAMLERQAAVNSALAETLRLKRENRFGEQIQQAFRRTM
jgi:hypothetical protein